LFETIGRRTRSSLLSDGWCFTLPRLFPSTSYLYE